MDTFFELTKSPVVIKIQSMNLNNKKILIIVMDEESDRSDFFGFRRNWNLAIPICPPKLNPSLGGDNRSRSNAVWRNFSKYSNSGNGNYFLINKICIHGFHEFFCAYDIEIKLKIKSDSFIIYPIGYSPEKHFFPDFSIGAVWTRISSEQYWGFQCDAEEKSSSINGSRFSAIARNSAKLFVKKIVINMQLKISRWR